MKIRYSRRFLKRFDKTPCKIQEAFKNRLLLFIKNRLHPLLNNHKLSGDYSDYWSINITGDWRAIYQFIDSDDVIVFHSIGTHSQLYK